MSTRERRLQPHDEDYLGPVAVAQFVELGWLVQWPMAWTRNGLRALRNGYGRWERTRQVLPIVTTPSERGAAYWQGRRAAPAGGDCT